MSDTPQGPGWWLASDGKWYPPAGQAVVPAAPSKRGLNNWALVGVVIGATLLVVLLLVAVLAPLGSDTDTDTSSDNATSSDNDTAAADDASSSGGHNSSGSGEHAPEDDVELTDCGTDQFHFFSATLDVTNHSSDPSTYVIEVTFETRDGSRQLGSGTAIVSSLRHGQATTVEAGSIDEPQSPQQFDCVIADISRFAS